LLGWGRFGSISAPFGEPASRFTSATERSGIWKKVREPCLNTVGCNLKKLTNMYKKACAAVGNLEELYLHFAYPVVSLRQLDDQGNERR
jgi:hypothetical protein